MTNILIAVDGSKSSLKALDYVAARKRCGESMQVFLINVQPVISARSHMISRAEIADYQAQQHEKVFSSSAMKTKKRYLAADAYNEVGDTAECIVRFARKSKCSEIVMGSRGLSPVRGLFLGSVVMKVVQLATVPVVIVK